MASFDQFLPLLLRFEGGFVDHPAYPGGATNKGVTMKTFQGCARRLLGIEPTLANLKALTDAQAGKIYKALYWDAIKGDQIESQELANIVFDFHVNAGANATKMLQRVLNELSPGSPQLAVDGAIGPATIAAIKRVDALELYRCYRKARIDYYHNLVNQRSGLKVFLKGWLNRVNHFPEL